MKRAVINEANLPLLSREVENHEQYAKQSYHGADLEGAFVSSIGGRSENQDCYGLTIAEDGTRVFCIADGLGGHAGGRIASEIAVKAVVDYVATPMFQFEQPLTIAKMFDYANQQVMNQQLAMPEYKEMRSTLLTLLIKDNLAFWAHAGDVRLYLIRNNEIYFQTKDHSVPQMLVDSGDIDYADIRTHADRGRLLSALGYANKPARFMTMSQQYTQLKLGDVFHLASDGFWEWIEEQKLLAVVKASISMVEALGEMELQVCRTAQTRSTDYDNYTAVNLEVKQAELNTHYWHKTHYKMVRRK